MLHRSHSTPPCWTEIESRAREPLSPARIGQAAPGDRAQRLLSHLTFQQQVRNWGQNWPLISLPPLLCSLESKVSLTPPTWTLPLLLNSTVSPRVKACYSQSGISLYYLPPGFPLSLRIFSGGILVLLCGLGAYEIWLRTSGWASQAPDPWWLSDSSAKNMDSRHLRGNMVLTLTTQTHMKLI